MEWREEYNIGVDVVDRAHQQLFSIVRRIMDLLHHGNPKKDRFACEEGIKYLKSYVVKHFAEEEAYMLSIGYEGYERHRAIHETLKRQTLPALEQQLEESGFAPEAVQHFLGVCIGWLTTHIMNEDQAIVGKGVKKLPALKDGSELYAMESLIPQIFQRTFGLEAVPMNEKYGGWDMGSALHYELLYATPAGKKLRAILVLEERLVLATTGQMVGLRFAEVNEIVLSAAKAISQTFLLNMAELMELGEDYGLTGDRLLSAEEFRGLYEKQPPQYSLLFVSGQGRFAFCFDRQ